MRPQGWWWIYHYTITTYFKNTFQTAFIKTWQDKYFNVLIWWITLYRDQNELIWRTLLAPSVDIIYASMLCNVAEYAFPTHITFIYFNFVCPPRTQQTTSGKSTVSVFNLFHCTKFSKLYMVNMK
jgi:hypothetical protein